VTTVTGGGDEILNKVRAFILTHPLATVVIAASLFRLLAVIWSKGFIHNDDHFETVVISQDWLTSGLFGTDGLLHWLRQPASDITRFPLYTLFVYAIMKAETWLGIQSLDSMMYGVRLAHALISMLPVIFTYKTVKLVTRDDRWAVIGGLFAGLHFAAPFLGVRNLIEVVGGELWLVSLYAFYQYAYDKKIRWLYLAGVITGLAWMIRFQIAFAALPIPFVLWYDTRKLTPAIHYGVAVAIMILLAWTADFILLGRFAGSSLMLFNYHALYDTMYHTIPGLYIVVLLGLFIPPMSFILVWLAGRPSFVRKHRLIVFSTLSFVLFHWFLRNQQERFLFPMLPAFILIFTLALWDRWNTKKYILARRGLFRGLAGVTLAMNAVLLIVLVFSYGHRGLIEPVLRLSKTYPSTRVLYLHPNMRGWVPVQYGPSTMNNVEIRNWDEWKEYRAQSETVDPPDYFVIHPFRTDSLAACVDSAQAVFGPLTPAFRVRPSPYDRLLHTLNPRHNPSYEGWVYRRAGDVSESL
jgi:uncharacterized membrane protein